MLEENHIYHSTTFQKLLSKKRIFVSSLTLFFFAYYLLLPILTSYFPTLMTYKVYGNFSFAWVFAFSQFIMTGAICLLYYIKAKSFDRMVEEVKTEYVARGTEK
jgi:uncharacterized membrane protein (DUF485 family)